MPARRSALAHLRRLGSLALVAAAACADAVAPTPRASAPSPAADLVLGSEGRGVLHRYVAIGTSVSMGWASDGVRAESQAASWPAQLTRMAGRELTQPYIDGFGCRAPLRAPLATGVRISGEAPGAAPGSYACAELLPGITLPTQNVAIGAATAANALLTTPETQTDAFYTKLYPRILPPGMTQVTAMEAQNPKLVSVELGANEVLNARSGIAIPGVTLVPYSSWAPVYDAILDRVAAATKHAVVVGLIEDVGTFPSFRRGDELWADRLAFLHAFHVEVSADCDGSPNLLFVPVRVPTAVATGIGRRNAGLSPFVLSCAAGGPGAQDFVLTPSEVAVVNALMAQMTAHIRAQAEQRGWAYFALEALYGRSDIKPPFSVVSLMTSPTPYGPLVSLDGLHPSAAGQRVLAEAAAAALDATYGLGIRTASTLAAR